MWSITPLVFKHLSWLSLAIIYWLFKEIHKYLVNCVYYHVDIYCECWSDLMTSTCNSCCYNITHVCFFFFKKSMCHREGESVSKNAWIPGVYCRVRIFLYRSITHFSLCMRTKGGGCGLRGTHTERQASAVPWALDWMHCAYYCDASLTLENGERTNFQPSREHHNAFQWTLPLPQLLPPTLDAWHLMLSVFIPLGPHVLPYIYRMHYY